MSAWTEIPSADTRWLRACAEGSPGHTACVSDGLTFDTKA
jgi:hypothetical protein